MCALKQSQCYGLSGGKGGGNVSVFHVKLTDSAARAIGTFNGGKGSSSHPTISFSGNQGRISIPRSDSTDEVRTFTFDVNNIARDNPHGSFECVQQHTTSATEELSCLGVIQKKMTVNATDDSYDKAIQSMAQAEEETRSRGAIVIKHGGRYQGKKVTVRPPTPALAGLTKPKPSSHLPLLSSIRKGGVSRQKKSALVSNRRSVSDLQERPLRERVSHLLALRPYRKPDMILRLQKDGLKAADKDLLDSVLMEVGQLNSRDKAFILKDNLYKELQKDWPGYTSGDQQLLKRILVRRLFQPQQNLLSVPEAQVSPLRDTPNSSPAHHPKPSLQEEYTDPVAKKKPRISHLSSKAASDKLRLRLDGHRTKTSLDPRKLVDSLSEVCQLEAEAPTRLEPPPSAQEEPEGAPDPPPPPPPLIVPVLNTHTISRKKTKHKDQEKDRWRDKRERRKDPSSDRTSNEVSSEGTESNDILFDSSILQADNDVADYLTKYTVISNHNQRQNYKMDFNKEYSEYRDLHARIDGTTRQFMKLDSQLKRQHRQSHKYKTVRNQILQEYRKIKKSNPNYSQDKIRCEYLHNKLAHIKKLISEYDQQQLHFSPN